MTAMEDFEKWLQRLRIMRTEPMIDTAFNTGYAAGREAAARARRTSYLGNAPIIL